MSEEAPAAPTFRAGGQQQRQQHRRRVGNSFARQVVAARPTSDQLGRLVDVMQAGHIASAVATAVQARNTIWRWALFVEELASAGRDVPRGIHHSLAMEFVGELRSGGGHSYLTTKPTAYRVFQWWPGLRPDVVAEGSSLHDLKKKAREAMAHFNRELGCARTTKRKPMLVPTLAALQCSLNFATRRGLRDGLLYLLSFVLALRAKDLVNVVWGSVELVRDGDDWAVRLSVRQYKEVSSTQEALFRRRTDPRFCLVTLVIAMGCEQGVWAADWALRDECRQWHLVPRMDQETFFPAIPLADEAPSDILQHHLAALGRGNGEYAMKSFRSGMVTQMCLNAMRDGRQHFGTAFTHQLVDHMQMMGRWLDSR